MAGRVDYYVGVRWATIAVVAAAAVGVVAVPLVTGGGGGGAETANLWVRTTSCDATPTRQSPAVALADSSVEAIACAPAQAWNAANAGDTIRVQNGVYGGVNNFTSDKASETFVYGESRAGVELRHTGSATDCGTSGFGFDSGPFCFNGNNMTWENLSLNSQEQHGASSAGRVGGTNVRLENLHVKGTYASFWQGGNGGNFTWSGGVFGESGVQGQRHCSVNDGEPFQFEGANGTIENVYFFPQGSDQTPHACSANGFHLETIRVQGVTATIRNVYFADGAEAGSGHIFYSGAGACCNQIIEGSYFGPNSDGSTSMQNHSNLGTCSNWRIDFNYISQGTASDCTESGWTFTGNVGNTWGCFGTHVKNIQVGSGTCGTDTFVASFAALGMTGGRPDAGSPAIDAGPATCPNLPFDFDGNARPQGSTCDAGAFERPS